MNEIAICGGTSHPSLVNDVCDYVGKEQTNIEVQKFSNEELFVQIKETVRERDVFYIYSPGDNKSDTIMEMLITINALKEASAGRITVIPTYLPYVRSDKKDQPRVSITARLMADMIQTAGAKRVLTFELHAEQILGFFKVPADQLYAHKLFHDHIINSDLYKRDSIAVAPDAGATKKTAKYADMLGINMALLHKHRHGNTETSSVDMLVGDVEDKDCIIFDDEIASGGTLCNAADFLMEKGASSVRAMIVHPVLSGSALENIENSALTELIVTDSIPVLHKAIDCQKITIISIATLLGNAINRIHNGQSINKLFEVKK